MLRKLSVLGIIAPILYLIHVILGGILWKGYNHITQPISDLTAAAAPNRETLMIFTNLSGILGLIFIVSTFSYLRKLHIKTINIFMIFALAVSIITLSYGFFPEDLPGTPMTFRGIMHLVVTGLIVPAAILSPLFAGLGFRKLHNFKKFSIYSIATSLIIFVSGAVSVIFIANNIPYLGVIERINIGSLELWNFIFALIMLTTDV